MILLKAKHFYCERCGYAYSFKKRRGLYNYYSCLTCGNILTPTTHPHKLNREKQEKFVQKIAKIEVLVPRGIKAFISEIYWSKQVRKKQRLLQEICDRLVDHNNMESIDLLLVEEPCSISLSGKFDGMASRRRIQIKRDLSFSRLIEVFAHEFVHSFRGQKFGDTRHKIHFTKAANQLHGKLKVKKLVVDGKI